MFKMQLKYKHQHRNIHLDSTTQGTQPMLKNEPDMQSIKISKFLISRDDTSHIFPTNSVKILSVLRYLVHGSKQNINVSKTNYILRYTRLTRVNCSFIISNKTYPTHQTKQINTILLPTPVTPILNNSKLFLNLTQILALLSKLMLQPTFQSQAKFFFFLNITMWAGVPSEPLCLHTQSLATAQNKLKQHYYPLQLPYSTIQNFFQIQHKFQLYSLNLCFNQLFSHKQNLETRHKLLQTLLQVLSLRKLTSL
eukprot:TRINITY_DN4846_c0_g1_i4.p1 TRINITY_DN4846_c0_g1~~TRINITY_DN4846_c0_g1_i4.p1  ORF type:complete len:270 (-),score=-8.65 TRINITY_DN4846_c0_g1_i4:512-1267(-)